MEPMPQSFLVLDTEQVWYLLYLHIDTNSYT
jgi:hypothetical protein